MSDQIKYVVIYESAYSRTDNIPGPTDAILIASGGSYSIDTSPIPTLTDYVFEGWRYGSTINPTEIDATEFEYNAAENRYEIILDAVWRRVYNFTINYLASPGETYSGLSQYHLPISHTISTADTYSPDESDSTDYGLLDISKINPSREGYYIESGQEWIGVSVDDNDEILSKLSTPIGDQENIDIYEIFEKATENDPTVVDMQDTTVYIGLNWKAIEYTINYYDGDYIIDVQNKSYNEEFTTLELGEVGKTFIGWNTKSDGSGIWFYPGNNYKNLSTKNGDTIDLYAQWSVDSLLIIYHGSGPNGLNQVRQIVDKDDEIILPSPEDLGFYSNNVTLTVVIDEDLKDQTTYSPIFECWRTSEESSYGSPGDPFWANSIEGDQIDLYMYCEYEDVEFNYIQEDYYKEGHSFIKWESDSGVVYNYGDFISLDSDLTIYARWEEETYTINFYDINKELYSVESVSYSSDLVLPYIEDIEGFNFIGWQIHDSDNYVLVTNRYEDEEWVTNDTIQENIDDYEYVYLPRNYQRNLHQEILTNLHCYATYIPISYPIVYTRDTDNNFVAGRLYVRTNSGFKEASEIYVNTDDGWKSSTT